LSDQALPMVTVVIPTWNAGRYLQATLDSVFAQSYPAFEIVAVDDCSSDHTVSLLKSYGDRVRVVERTVNSGTADIPRYQGVEAARTELVALLDGDDVWEREKLAKQVAFMGANPQIPLSHHYVRIMDADGRAGPVRHDGIIPPTGPCAKELLSRCFICTSSVMVRREAWLGAQSPDQITGYGTELDFFIALARRSNLGFIPEVLGSYRVFPGSISRKSWRRYPRDVGAMERIFRKGLWRGVVGRREMKAIIHEACMESADAHRDLGYAGRSLYFCGLGALYRPLHTGAWFRAVKGVGRFLLPVSRVP
jgi:teichuronic acid biosynthesis glycosyltransferase TuaG